jgi:hypothetical protein
MKEHPILFSGEMVRAILEGRKTQTRRVIRKQPHGMGSWVQRLAQWFFPECCPYVKIKCPYGSNGDVIWVKETFQFFNPECPSPGGIVYRADGDEDWHWRPSIFMPRWASRIQLRVVDVRVERVQDISGKDAYEEGFAYERVRIEKLVNQWSLGESKMPNFEGKEIDWFHQLWDSINKKRGYGWDTNPWVWVIEFERIPGVQVHERVGYPVVVPPVK